MGRLFSFLIVTNLILWAPAAEAALPSGERVLEVLEAQQLAPLTFVVNYVEEAPKGGTPSLALRVVGDAQGRARIDTLSLRSGETQSRYFGAQGQEGVTPLEQAPFWLQWWMGRPVRDLVARGGVKSERVSLAHIEGVVVWVLGAGPRERVRPQVHVEREGGRLRAVMGGDEMPIMEAAQLDDYILVDTLITRFPARLTLRRQGRHVTLVNTWLKRGAEVTIGPEELTPPAKR